MTTDQLTSLLTTDLTPVDKRRLPRALIIALAAGAIMAFGLTFLVFGPHPENFSSRYLDVELAKLVFTSSVVVLTAVFLPRLARPGEVESGFVAVVSVPFVAITIFAIAALASAHWSAWASMAVGTTWITCLFFIPLLAIGPFVAVVCALRTGAPTDLAAAGTAAGLVASGLSAMACSLPCLDESFPSIAVWYRCAALGAKLGPSVLRW
jgi:hypothetical protein